MRCACHEICTSRFTKCCACHEICTSRFAKCCTSHEICTLRFTKCCTCHEICTSRFTQCCTCHEICTSRSTKCCTCHEICTFRFTKCCACHEICTSRVTECCATKSANEPHVQKSRFTAPVTKSELLDDHHHVQNAAPATKTAFRSKTAPIPCTCHEKSTLDPPKHEVSLAPATKSDHHVQKCARHHNESAVARSTRGRPQILRACAVEVHMDDVERHECTVNSNELDVHGRAPQRSKHTFFSLTVRTPQCAHTVWGTKDTFPE